MLDNQSYTQFWGFFFKFISMIFRTAKSYSNAHFGQGNGNIIMDDVQCGGNESSIFSCPFNGWFNHNCHATEDSGVSCGL